MTRNGPGTADGRLKAAAPQLLAACEMAADYLIAHDENHLVLHILRAAIAQAKGQEAAGC